MKVIATEKHVIKSWCNEPEDGAIEQAKNLANLPFIFKHVALMPDTHFGVGVPIGSVFASRDIVIPNAVGSDIGCGMIFVRSTYKGEKTPDMLKKILGTIRKVIPNGLGGSHKAPFDMNQMPQLDCSDFLVPHTKDAAYQLGTLGSSNHFIEIQEDPEGYLCIMIHSGSRNLGKQVCDYYNKLSEKKCMDWHAPFPKDLAWLPMNSKEGEDYWKDMTYALDFALRNRNKMLYEAMDITKNIMEKYYSQSISFGNVINIHHNYANIENHFHENVVVHRKGATSARLGEIGLIPGCQGTKSCVVVGKGNPESFQSCSHGAGRKMGRKDAVRRLNLKDELDILEKRGVIHGIRNQSDLEESSGVYKDISTVMEEQKDLVDIVTELKPLAVIKNGK